MEKFLIVSFGVLQKICYSQANICLVQLRLSIKLGRNSTNRQNRRLGFL